MTRWLVVLLLVLATGAATAAPVPKALNKPEPTRISLLLAMERAERHTKLLFRSKMPAGEIEIDWPWAAGETPPEGELLAALNEQLVPHGYVLTRKSLSFGLQVIGR